MNWMSSSGAMNYISQLLLESILSCPLSWAPHHYSPPLDYLPISSLISFVTSPFWSPLPLSFPFTFAPATTHRLKISLLTSSCLKIFDYSYRIKSKFSTTQKTLYLRKFIYSARRNFSGLSTIKYTILNSWTCNYIKTLMLRRIWIKMLSHIWLFIYYTLIVKKLWFLD